MIELRIYGLPRETALKHVSSEAFIKQAETLGNVWTLKGFLTSVSTVDTTLIYKPFWIFENLIIPFNT